MMNLCKNGLLLFKLIKFIVFFQESNIESSDPNEEQTKPELLINDNSDSVSTTTTTTNSAINPSSQEYHLKWIKWKGGNGGSNGSNNNNNNNGNGQTQQQCQKVPIVTQNSNGSCPLLAIINVLLLRKNITFPPIIEIVTASQLLDYICDCILTYVPKGKLYQLVTDQGFLTEPNVVWESLNNIEGDDYFVDADFQLVPPKPLSLLPSSSTMTTDLPNLNTQQQIDQDYLIALSLEQEQNFELDQQQQDRTTVKSRACSDDSNNNNNNSSNKTTITDENQKILMSDEELAWKLQAEEDQYYEQQSRQQRKQSPMANDNKTYASVLSSSSQKQQITKSGKDFKSDNCLPNHYHQIPSAGNTTNASSSYNPRYHQQSQTTKSSSTITSSEPYQQHPRTSTSTSNYHHHQHKQHQHAQHPSVNQSHHQRSTATAEQSVSTPVTPTTTTTRTIPDDRQSVSSRRSQNKNVCL
ncbi:DUF544 domain containing protein [Euroglyphus maynei]|uniref:Ubiquitin carboxyl-terminal hydrolase n=1 Tax=Euroglyphus maynei TaxID=6958 RepID=A0A1Y3ASH2_EURMA|nr:DUF544 domain containing protein [Euroglyphus maynei]